MVMLTYNFRKKGFWDMKKLSLIVATVLFLCTSLNTANAGILGDLVKVFMLDSLRIVTPDQPNIVAVKKNGWDANRQVPIYAVYKYDEFKQWEKNPNRYTGEYVQKPEPISPYFDTDLELADWLVSNAKSVLGLDERKITWLYALYSSDGISDKNEFISDTAYKAYLAIPFTILGKKYYFPLPWSSFSMPALEAEFTKAFLGDRAKMLDLLPRLKLRLNLDEDPYVVYRPAAEYHGQPFGGRFYLYTRKGGKFVQVSTVFGYDWNELVEEFLGKEKFHFDPVLSRLFGIDIDEAMKAQNIEAPQNVGVAIDPRRACLFMFNADPNTPYKQTTTPRNYIDSLIKEWKTL